MDIPRFEVGDIEQEWPWVELALQRVAVRDQQSWSPHHVRAEIEAGDAHFFVCPHGFVVWRIRVCEFSGKRTFWVWVAYGEGGDILGRYEEQLAQLARMCGAECIAFSSSRRGYLRRLKRPWRAVRVEYERSV